MKDRIKMIMEAEEMTPARFADTLEIGRAVISHILNDRNKPGTEILSRIALHMPHINTDWLLTGRGSMYKNEQPSAGHVEASVSDTSPVSSTDLFSQDLFSQNQIHQPQVEPEPEYRKENIVEDMPNSVQEVVKERIIYKERPEKKISKIIIYYTDNTFESFNANSNPL